jgi:hypothetical protein
MIEIINSIETKNWQSLNTAIDKHVDQLVISADFLKDVLTLLPAIVLVYPDELIVEYKGNQKNWHRFESLIWDIGEKFRQILKRQKMLRMDRDLFSHLERVALDKQFCKGRDSFVMLLGQYGSHEVVGTLTKLLNDQEVQGHDVYALRLLGAPEVQESIRQFLQSRKTWIRNEAKKYFAKLDKQKL